MQLGIFSKTFPGSDPARVLGAVRAAGYTCTQFNMACAGLPPLPDTIGDTTVAAIRAASAGAGVAVVALSGTYNMIHPDPAVRSTGLRRLGVMLQAAQALGVGLVTLCTGTRDPDDQWRYHPDNARPEAWSDLYQEMTRALEMAEAAGVDLGIEPEQANVVTSAEDARRLIEAMGSARLRVIFDPANLFEVAGRAQARAIVADALDTASDRIAMVHAKDRLPDGRFATAGTGVVDFPDLIARLHRIGFAGPLVTHGLQADEAAGVAKFLAGLISP
jgi:sugar phosphate isomerase/epimerase